MRPAAVGALRRRTVCGASLLISPEAYMWLVPSCLTLALAVVCLWDVGAVAWRHSPTSVVGFVAAVAAALGTSLAVVLTDPGVVPAATQLAPDPYSDLEEWRLCRQCQIRRPPRAAHCYVCGVCVLEHDHHCGVIGGCVGMRSLRWFTLYLVSLEVACGIGCWWLTRESFPITSHRLASLAVAKALLAHLCLLGIGVAVEISVGGFALYYMYLVCTNTTRREAQGLTQNRTDALNSVPYYGELWPQLQRRLAWRYLGRIGEVLHPPPSLVVG